MCDSNSGPSRKLLTLSSVLILKGRVLQKSRRPTSPFLKTSWNVVEETSTLLRHVTFYQGGKSYGADLGPFKTAAREDDPRLMPPNFYYDQDQEDLLRQRQQGSEWYRFSIRNRKLRISARGCYYPPYRRVVSEPTLSDGASAPRTTEIGTTCMGVSLAGDGWRRWRTLSKEPGLLRRRGA